MRSASRPSSSQRYWRFHPSWLFSPVRVALDILLAGHDDRRHRPEGDQDAPSVRIKQGQWQNARQTNGVEDAAPPPFGAEEDPV